MTDLREAAEKALEALKNYGQGNSEPAAALRQALAQTEQEPVRWINFNAATGRESIDDYCDSELASIPLYTAPPKREWKGLTMDDKHFLLANAWNKEQAFDGFMDAIDKFLKEKNR